MNGRRTRLFVAVLLSLLLLGTTLTAGAQSILPMPRISSLTPTKGPIGTVVVIKGSGFTPDSNQVNFGSGIIRNLRSYDGQTLRFAVPSYLEPPCRFASPPCMIPAVQTRPGEYKVSVTNRYGTSNSLVFTVIVTS